MINTFTRVFALLGIKFPFELYRIHKPTTNLFLMSKTVLFLIKATVSISSILLSRRTIRMKRIVIIAAQDQDSRPIICIPICRKIANMIVILNTIKIGTKSKDEMTNSIRLHNHFSITIHLI
jgi:hypothetical protein